MLNSLDSKFGLLRGKSIIAILNGDVQFGEIDNILISMPYLSGPDIISISKMFGLNASYTRNGITRSRWEYMDAFLNTVLMQII